MKDIYCCILNVHVSLQYKLAVRVVTDSPFCSFNVIRPHLYCQCPLMTSQQGINGVFALGHWQIPVYILVALPGVHFI